jgi:hypothetical protein
LTQIFVLGANTPVGSAVIQALHAQGQTVLSDAHDFGDAASLTRGHLLDQLRRFGPFETFITVVAPPEDQIVYAADALPLLVEQPLRALSAATDLWGESERQLIVINGLEMPRVLSQFERIMLENLIMQTPRILGDLMPSLAVSIVTADEALGSPKLI